MRKGVMIAYLVVLVHNSNAQLQQIFSNVDEVQFTAGPSIVSLYNENISSDQRQLKIGYTVRGALIYNLNKKISLGFNFMFERKGLKTKLQASYYDESIDSLNCLCTTSEGYIENNSHRDYLTFSITPRYFIIKGLYTSVGPYISYLLKVQVFRTNLWDGTKSYRTGSQTSKNYDLGVHFGLGYYIPISDRLSITSEVSNTFGLLNTGDTRVTSTETTTNSLSLQIGLNLKL